MKRLLYLFWLLTTALSASTALVEAQEAHHHDPEPSAGVECVTVSRGCTIEDYLLTLLRTEGVGTAMSVLDSLAAGDADVRRDAHAYAHTIGLAAFTGPTTVGEVFGSCTPAHQSGCYHGVIQAYFLDHASAHGPHLDGSLINALCADQRADGGAQWLIFQCAHGMGHGLLMLADHHLPTSLEWCDLVSDPWERESCYGGAFMENIVSTTSPHHAPARSDRPQAADDEHAQHGTAMAAVEREPFPPLKREDPFYPCTAVDDRYLAACYQMQTSAVLYFNRQDLNATARLCTTVPEAYRSTCFQSLGRDISSITMQDHSRAMRLCAVAPPALEPFCHMGYAKNLVDVTADANDGFEYCRLLPSGESKRVCHVAIGEQVWVLTDSPERRAQMCLAADPEYLSSCRHGAGLVEPGASRIAVPVEMHAYSE